MSYSRLDMVSYTNATSRAKRTAARILEQAEQLTKDPDKADRQSRRLCKVCHYIHGRVGGSMITRSPCAACGKEMMFGNTCVDTLCPDCAPKLGLCKHCGGDLEMKIRRKPSFRDTPHTGTGSSTGSPAPQSQT